MNEVKRAIMQTAIETMEAKYHREMQGKDCTEEYKALELYEDLLNHLRAGQYDLETLHELAKLAKHTNDEDVKAALSAAVSKLPYVYWEYFVAVWGGRIE